MIYICLGQPGAKWAQWKIVYELIPISIPLNKDIISQVAQTSNRNFKYSFLSIHTLIQLMWMSYKQRNPNIHHKHLWYNSFLCTAQRLSWGKFCLSTRRNKRYDLLLLLDIHLFFISSGRQMFLSKIYDQIPNIVIPGFYTTRAVLLPTAPRKEKIPYLIHCLDKGEDEVNYY